MPLTSIAMRAGKSAAYKRAVADSVHQALVEVIGIPADDRFQLINEYGAQEFIFDPAFLGMDRTDNLVIIQIILRCGRSRELRAELHQKIAALLAKSPGVRADDVFVTLVENDYADWSVGRGEAPLLKLLPAS